MSRKLRALLAACAGAVAYTGFVRPWMRHWGATPVECRKTMPGDELVPFPADQTTRAITIHAAPHDVWPWLAQMGQNRAGFYTYSRLENLAGLRIRNAEFVVPQWQHLRVGDEVRLVPKGWLGGPGFSVPVAEVHSDRAIVLRMPPESSPWDAVWTFAIEPIYGGSTCRLYSRGRSAAMPLWMKPVGYLIEPVLFVMERGMLKGIKVRAEYYAPRPLALFPPHHSGPFHEHRVL